MCGSISNMLKQNMLKKGGPVLSSGGYDGGSMGAFLSTTRSVLTQRKRAAKLPQPPALGQTGSEDQTGIASGVTG